MNPADSDTEYAFWTTPGDRLTVTYSLPVFHDIDFQVSEGFRRIPHGGVETGGLLFGRLEQSSGQVSAWIEAFRSIECEHESGPSFRLSNKDIAGLREQLAASASDPELQGLEALGWFVAHTRSALEMNEREAALFEELFPGPGRLLVLVKPERFQATRFAFLARDAGGRVDPDGTSKAIILPLPGRAGKTSQGPAASIPAPAQSAKAPAPASPKAPEPVPGASRAGTPPEAVPAAPGSLPPKPKTVQPEVAAPSFWQDVPPQSPLSTPIVRIEEQAAEASAERSLTVLPAARPSRRLPPSEEITQLAPGRIPEPEPVMPPVSTTRRTRKMGRDGGPSALRFVLLLLLAAGLGCAVGYLAYRQLPSATIALNVQRQPRGDDGVSPGLFVSWPPEETRDAIFASIRVDDGEAMPLSTQQKAEGRAMVPAGNDNVKIELIAQRRWRDSRGIVRYVRAKAVTP